MFQLVEFISNSNKKKRKYVAGLTSEAEMKRVEDKDGKNNAKDCRNGEKDSHQFTLMFPSSTKSRANDVLGP